MYEFLKLGRTYLASYIKTALFNPKNIYQAKNMDKGQSIGYFIFIVLIIFISLLGIIFPVFTQLSDDSQEIADQIPEFTVENGQLETSEDSYIHLTDSFTFFFDPSDEISQRTIEQNLSLQSSPIALGILTDEIYFNFNGNEQSISYDQFGNFDDNSIRELFNQFSSFSIVSILIVLAILFLLTSFVFLWEFIPIVIFAYMIALFSRNRIRFFDSAKMVAVAITLPTLLFSIINLFGIVIPFQYELRFIFTLILFGVTLHEMKQQKSKKE